MRHRLTVLLVALVTLLTACSTALPTAPAPRPGLPVDVQPQQDVQHFLSSPQPGASPREIVEGFLRANVGFAADDDVAREFLTPDLASAWVPTADVVVIDATPQLRVTDEGEVTVTAPAAGHIDAEGRLVERTGEVSETFELTRLDGQWRIDGFPEDFGLWLSKPDLDRAFRDTLVYYLSPQQGYFVPEQRWLPRGEGLTTAVARTQLGPVPTYLEGAVRTGASPDVHLAVGAVPVDPVTQLATVNLQGAGLGEDTRRIHDLRAQLGHALLGLSGVAAVELRLDGRSLLPDEGAVNLGSDLGYEDLVRTTQRALLRVGESFTLVDPRPYNLRNLPPSETSGVELPRLGLSWTGVAVTADLSEFAAVSTDRSRLWRWRDGDEAINEGIGDRLTDPSYDVYGGLWIAGDTRGGGPPRVWVVEGRSLNATARLVDVPWIDAAARITDFRVSPEGTRALLVVQRSDGRGQRLLVAGIVRDREGRPTALTSPLEVAPTLVEVGSARWASTSSIVAAARRAQDQRLLPYSVPLGGWLEDLGEQPGLVDVVAVPTGQGYAPVVRTDDGRFHTREGNRGWLRARNGDELIIPGT
ncbi:LpqB family beta-propeller domain-containing protein [Ornithinimicrobium avium]|uniref:Uncharacterized protein n=1 Tax=Ornithinimicrobium avium TaxID=2283195 RepID=A0A345NLC0_9MICO|nr:LpqB family beta-propeller domain-containing protein [Ornithinimicrobium avium]AXH95828.1 hypothetical protein DV701_06520 [Ornithinimicrobium avium]